MTDKLQQTIKEELAELPKEVQEAISSIDWIRVAEEIGKENSLDEEQVEDFQLETLLVLTAIVDPEFYAVNIENHVSTTKDKAESMANEGFAKIFNPIIAKLEDNTKRSMDKKSPSWEQNLDFVLSGGDYSTLIGAKDNTSTTTVEDNMLLKRPSVNSQRRMEDIKSKFTI